LLKSFQPLYKRCANKVTLKTDWWGTPIVPALGRLRQEERGLEVSLGYLVRPCLNTTKQKSYCFFTKNSPRNPGKPKTVTGGQVHICEHKPAVTYRAELQRWSLRSPKVIPTWDG
jgi:hypothetical protein